MDIVNLLFSFKGRVTRTTYWITEIAAGVMILGPSYALFGSNSDAASLYETMAMLLLLWPLMAIQSKRWHDRDKSAYWLLINLVPFIGFIWALIENGFLRGTMGDNGYGPDPSADDKGSVA